MISVVVMVDGGSLLEGWGFLSWPKHHILVGQSYLGHGWGGDLLATSDGAAANARCGDIIVSGHEKQKRYTSPLDRKEYFLYFINYVYAIPFSYPMRAASLLSDSIGPRFRLRINSLRLEGDVRTLSAIGHNAKRIWTIGRLRSNLRVTFSWDSNVIIN